MIRNLKALIVAAMAVASFGAIGASGAQAAEEFHCSVEPCTLTLKPDGVGNTTHHVLTVKNSVGTTATLTCKKIEGHATSTKATSTDITFTGLAYKECNYSGYSAEVEMNGCEYTITSPNGAIFNPTGSQIHILCPIAKYIELKADTTETPGPDCILAITPQTVNGLRYANIGSEANTTTEVTAMTKVPGIVIEVKQGNVADCLFDPTKPPFTAEYSTGNTIVTAETHEGAMKNVWWA